MLGSRSKPKSFKQYIDPSERIESLRDYGPTPVDIGKSVVSSLKKDVGVGIVSGVFEQLMSPGQEIILGNKAEQKPEKIKRPDIAAGIDYHSDIVKGVEKIHRQTEQMLSRRVEEIKQELAQILGQVQELSQRSEFATIAVEQTPQQIGKYYDTFFDWLLMTVRNIRMQVEDSGNWLQAVNGKSKKLNYWGMFKKHGTMFGLSGERSVSNQVA